MKSNRRLRRAKHCKTPYGTYRSIYSKTLAKLVKPCGCQPENHRESTSKAVVVVKLRFPQPRRFEPGLELPIHQRMKLQHGDGMGMVWG